MQTEYEATFLDINKDKIRKKLKSGGARLVQAEYLQKRYTFNLPQGQEINGAWLRVRQEKDKITMSLKITNDAIGGKIDEQKEICLAVDDFDSAVEFLEMIGCKKKAYQENKRELWQLGKTEITIDEWPFLEPIVEIEGPDEKTVQEVSRKLSFDYSQAYFCSVTTLYAQKYHIPDDVINNKIPRIVFNMKNPLLKFQRGKQ